MKRISKTNVEKFVKKGALLADVRSPVAFRDGHIAGAVNLPLRNLVNKLTALPKSTKVILYSESLTDVDLTQGYRYAEQLGFTEIFVALYKDLQ